MIKYFKMKKMERDLKYALYSSVAAIMREQADMAALVQRLYVSLKDVPADELRDTFIRKIAEIVHESNGDKDVES